jgi:hypothetical protein
MTRGILYVATGKRYIEEAIQSIRSVRRHMPDISIAVYTDSDQLSFGQQYADDLIDWSLLFQGVLIGASVLAGLRGCN